MPLLQRIIEHLQKLVLVSNITIALMVISIISMSVTYLYCIFKKNNNYENIIVKIGIFIRILMFIGFTIEFSYQKVNYQGGLGNIFSKYNAMEQFSNYIFYGYIFVIGIYDIYTIEINKFRGVFHTFDLAMVSIPILYGLTALILNFKFDSETAFGLVIIIALILLPFMFFKLYWKQNIRWYALFFIYIIANLIMYKIKGMITFFNYTLVSYLLIGLYELTRHWLNKYTQRYSNFPWSKFKVVSMIVPVILIFSCIVVVNFSPFQINKKYYIESIYKENAAFTSLHEAENLARVAVDDIKSPIYSFQGKLEDFNNIYRFSIDNYSVEIDGATGKLFQLRNINDKKVEIQETLTEEEIKTKTIEWLKSLGYSYDEKYSQMEIYKYEGKYIVKLFNKYNDGSVDKDSRSEIQWYVNGKVYSAALYVLNINDYKEIKIDETTINNCINSWYEALGEKVPAYEITSFLYWFGDTESRINVKCKNNDSFVINSNNGKIASFFRGNGKRISSSISDEYINKLRTKAEEIAKKFSNKWDKFNYNLIEDKVTNQDGHFTLKSSNEIVINYIDIELDCDGNLIYFNNGDGYFYDRETLYNDKDFKVSSSDALKYISKNYSFLDIYSKRVKLAAEVNEDGTVNYKWMVIVILFKSAEHRVYYVDTDTGEITPLLNYN